MFNNKGNNKDKKDYGVNTRGIQLKNKNGVDPSTILIGYWNDMVTLKIHPALPKEKQTQENVYDYEHALNTALTLDKVQVLIEGMKNLEQAMIEERAYSIGVKVGNTSVVLLSTGVKETGSVRPFIGVYKDLDADSERAGQGIRYEFNTSDVIVDYDPNTGESEAKNKVPSEFIMFKVILSTAVKALGNAHVHSMRNVQNFFNSKQMETLTAVALKLGVDIASGVARAKSGNDGVFNMSNNNNNNSSTGYSAIPDAEVVEGSLGDDLPF